MELSRETAAAVLQSWVNAIRQRDPKDRFEIQVVIILKAPGKAPERFEIGEGE